MVEDYVDHTKRFWNHFTSALLENEVVFTVKSAIVMKFCFCRRQRPKAQPPIYSNAGNGIAV